jgi:hypothetical protein
VRSIRAKVRANLLVHVATLADAPTDAPAPALRYTLGEVYRFELARTTDGWRIYRLENVRLWVSSTIPTSPASPGRP